MNERLCQAMIGHVRDYEIQWTNKPDI